MRYVMSFLVCFIAFSCGLTTYPPMLLGIAADSDDLPPPKPPVLSPKKPEPKSEKAEASKPEPDKAAKPLPRGIFPRQPAPPPSTDPVVPPDLAAAIIKVETDNRNLSAANSALVAAQSALSLAQSNVTTATSSLNTDQSNLDIIYRQHYQPVVLPNATVTTITTIPNPANQGVNVSVNVAVAGGQTPPVGTGLLTLDNSASTTLQVSNGTSSATLTSLEVGTHTLVMTFTPSDSTKWAASSGSATTVVTQPTTGPISVLFYYDPSQWNDTTTQGEIRSDLGVRSYLATHCPKDESGTPSFRWIPVNDDGSKLPKSLQQAFTTLKGQQPAAPWWAVIDSTGKIRLSEAMPPDVQTALTKLKTFGGN